MNKYILNKNRASLLLLLLIISCKPSTPKDKIVGDWKFENTERTRPATDDDKSSDLHNQGLVATFRENGIFVSVRPGKDKIDTTGYGEYKISDDGKSLITMPVGARYPDTLGIKQLDSKMLKLFTRDSDLITFRRK